MTHAQSIVHALTQPQIRKLNDASSLPVPESRMLQRGVLELVLPVNGLAVIEIQSTQRAGMEGTR
jgi:hypothetical protein